MVELKRDIVRHAQIDRLLRISFKGVSTAPSSWASMSRAALRFESWLINSGHGIQHVSGPLLAQHLVDLLQSGPSVPQAALTALTSVSKALLLSWPTDHPLVVGVTKEANKAKVGRASYKQNEPLSCATIDQVKHLEQVACNAEVSLAVRWGAALACLLAHACLRFSDAQRSEGIRTNSVSIFGYTWKSKNQRSGFPWAALGSGWSGAPWAEALCTFMTAHPCVVDYVLPAFQKDLVTVKARPASYSQAVAWVRNALTLPPLKLDFNSALKISLHDFRRLLPTLSAQLGIAIESRRVLGHWGPNSAEPLRYDQSRCTSELAAKSYIAQQLSVGWSPVGDFQVPLAPVSQAPALVPSLVPHSGPAEHLVLKAGLAYQLKAKRYKQSKTKAKLVVKSMSSSLPMQSHPRKTIFGASTN